MKTDREQLLCTTCKYRGTHFIAALFGQSDFFRCYRPNLPIQLVTGERDFKFCDMERKRADAYHCGPDAKFHSAVFQEKVTP